VGDDQDFVMLFQLGVLFCSGCVVWRVTLHLSLSFGWYTQECWQAVVNMYFLNMFLGFKFSFPFVLLRARENWSWVFWAPN
jgi:hypothetical protein